MYRVIIRLSKVLFFLHYARSWRWIKLHKVIWLVDNFIYYIGLMLFQVAVWQVHYDCWIEVRNKENEVRWRSVAVGHFSIFQPSGQCLLGGGWASRVRRSLHFGPSSTFFFLIFPFKWPPTIILIYTTRTYLHTRVSYNLHIRSQALKSWSF